MMGSSLRRLWIYHSNNFGKTHVLALVTFIAFLLWLSRPQVSEDASIVKSRYGVVHYKQVVEPERMSSEDIDTVLGSLVDTRPVHCRDNRYDFARFDPPQSASIIVDFRDALTFYNIKLTLSSIIEHTPYDLYNEIILLDDGTTDENIRKQAAKFLQDPKFNKVKLYRSETRGGQSSAWYKSSMAAVGNLLVFVDSSVVVNQGWLQPLLSALIDDENVVAVPHADNILDDNRFFRTDDFLVNVFTWGMATVHFEAPAPTDLSGDTLDTPVARGDVIAVRRSFLDSIGGIDDGLHDDPGFGQHVELSLRTWMCGGAVRIVSCSHVAVRNSLRQRRVADSHNFQRIVELWFEDFRKTAYQQGGQQAFDAPTTMSESIAARRAAIRKTKNGAECHSFSWYLANVATPVLAPSDTMTHFGKLRAKTNYCLRTTESSGGAVVMDLCREYMYEPAAMFEMNDEGAIFRGDLCLGPGKSGRIEARPCDDDDINQKWAWLSDSRLGVKSKPGSCLFQVSERNPDTMELVHFAQMQACSSPDAVDRRKETWKFLNY